MKTARAALLGAAILLCCLSGVYSRLSFAEQPQDEVIIRSGEEDILTCVVNDDGIEPKSLVKWVVIVDEAAKEIYPGNPPFERYTYVDENHNGGNYNLRIANASPEDNAAFRCALDHGSTEEEYEYSNTAKVFVAVPRPLYYFMASNANTELEATMAAVL
ncbi:PREDICTED: uncharacterized protein LOC106816066 [Priapulus caudatus]|uniref:Uncharacterized protein LOC106816066 n=1 Tax=Priapulus caudatus TaxID=37621 RepID=A0ABM1EV86_PRICU|nr:PREDICTED: uncharacterized protein LOC106816066 [Priapulus caudatus]